MASVEVEVSLAYSATFLAHSMILMKYGVAICPTVAPTFGVAIGPIVGPTILVAICPTVAPTFGVTIGPTVGPTIGVAIGPTVLFPIIDSLFL